MAGVNSPMYQKGEAEVVAWINDILDMDVKVVEEVATGAIMCQLFDAMFPNANVRMDKLKWGQTSPSAWGFNWGIFHTAQSDCKTELAGIDKKIFVNKIMECKRSETLDIAQWAYGLFTHHYPDGNTILSDYDAKGRRALSRSGRAVNEFKVVDMFRNGNLKSQARKNAPRIAKFRQREGAAGAAGAAAAAPAKRAAPRTRAGVARPKPAAARTGPARKAAAKPVATGISQAVVDDLKAQIAELTAELETVQAEHDRLTDVSQAVESERDFYFGKVEACEKIVAPPVAEDEDVNDVIDALEEPEEMKEIRRRILEILWEQQEDAEAAEEEEVFEEGGEEVFEEAYEDDVAF